jgi:cell division protein FtsL
MKLNNKGWGFRDMFILMGILIAFLIVAIIMIYRYYDSMEKNIKDADRGIYVSEENK